MGVDYPACWATFTLHRWTREKSVKFSWGEWRWHCKQGKGGQGFTHLTSCLSAPQVILRDLEKYSSQGYVLGYELGYMKGVLEHVVKTCPHSTHDREVYIKGYVRGYAQGILYTMQKRAVDGRTNHQTDTKEDYGSDTVGRANKQSKTEKKHDRLEIHGKKCGNEDSMRWIHRLVIELHNHSNPRLFLAF